MFLSTNPKTSQAFCRLFDSFIIAPFILTFHLNITYLESRCLHLKRNEASDQNQNLSKPSVSVSLRDRGVTFQGQKMCNIRFKQDELKENVDKSFPGSPHVPN